MFLFRRADINSSLNSNGCSYNILIFNNERLVVILLKEIQIHTLIESSISSKLFKICESNLAHRSTKKRTKFICSGLHMNKSVSRSLTEKNTYPTNRRCGFDSRREPTIFPSRRHLVTPGGIYHHEYRKAEENEGNVVYV